MCEHSQTTVPLLGSSLEAAQAQNAQCYCSGLSLCCTASLLGRRSQSLPAASKHVTYQLASGTFTKALHVFGNSWQSADALDHPTRQPHNSSACGTVVQLHSVMHLHHSTAQHAQHGWHGAIQTQSAGH